MTSADWKGTVTTIRLDPCDATGTFILDKVMLVELDQSVKPDSKAGSPRGRLTDNFAD